MAAVPVGVEIPLLSPWHTPPMPGLSQPLINHFDDVHAAFARSVVSHCVGVWPTCDRNTEQK